MAKFISSDPAEVYYFNGNGPGYAHKESYGIEYACPWGFEEFEYNWHHIPSGKRGKTKIYCEIKNDLIRLIGFWNTSTWHYYL